MPTNPFPTPNTPNGDNKQERDRTFTSVVAGAMFPHEDSAADSVGVGDAGWGGGAQQEEEVCGKKGMMVY